MVYCFVRINFEVHEDFRDRFPMVYQANIVIQSKPLYMEQLHPPRFIWKCYSSHALFPVSQTDLLTNRLHLFLMPNLLMSNTIAVTFPRNTPIKQLFVLGLWLGMWKPSSADLSAEKMSHHLLKCCRKMTSLFVKITGSFNHSIEAMNAWAWRSRDHAISRYIANLLWTFPA